MLSGLLAIARQASAESRQLKLVAKVISIRAKPECGYFFFGSPVTYQIVAGPVDFMGKKITAVVPRIELPLIEGDVRKFIVGDIHSLRIAKEKPFRQLSTGLMDQSWFCLKAASFQESGSK